MPEQFNHLSKEEKQQLIKAPALITLLVTWSNNGTGRIEADGAYRFMKGNKFPSRPGVIKYYQEVLKNFYTLLDQILKESPSDKQERIILAVEHLRKLNSILPKLERDFAEQLYLSYTQLAKGVAKASGGEIESIPVHFFKARGSTLPTIDDPRTFNV